MCFRLLLLYRRFGRDAFVFRWPDPGDGTRRLHSKRPHLKSGRDDTSRWSAALLAQRVFVLSFLEYQATAGYCFRKNFARLLKVYGRLIVCPSAGSRPNLVLNVMLDRNGDVVDDYHTLESVPGKRFAVDQPIYVFTSNCTSSGAEELAYNLQHLNRAIVIGETTDGGAHPTRSRCINNRFVVGVPFLRARNPISGTNWEGTGFVQSTCRQGHERFMPRLTNINRY